MRKVETFKVTVTRDIPGEYVRGGETYTVTPSFKNSRATKPESYHFRNDASGGETFMQRWSYRSAVIAGQIVEDDAIDCSDRSFSTTPAAIVAEHEAEVSFINAQGFARASQQVAQ